MKFLHGNIATSKGSWEPFHRVLGRWKICPKVWDLARTIVKGSPFAHLGSVDEEGRDSDV